MPRTTRKQVVAALLERHGRTFAEELKIDLGTPSPSALFRLLCASLLFSARINSSIAVEAARGLSKARWNSAKSMAKSTWDDRVAVLNRAGYTRYQERTATMLGEVADRLLDRFGGDLRKLRDEADRDPDRERALLKQFKGVGDAGVDIFFREVQAAWDEIHPFADQRALKAADKLGLPADAKALARLVGRDDFARVVAALVRCDLEGDHEAILDAAGSSGSKSKSKSA